MLHYDNLLFNPMSQIVHLLSRGFDLESGTIALGIFSSHKKALAEALCIWRHDGEKHWTLSLDKDGYYRRSPDNPIWFQIEAHVVK